MDELGKKWNQCEVHSYSFLRGFVSAKDVVTESTKHIIPSYCKNSESPLSKTETMIGKNIKCLRVCVGDCVSWTSVFRHGSRADDISRHKSIQTVWIISVSVFKCTSCAFCWHNEKLILLLHDTAKKDRSIEWIVQLHRMYTKTFTHKPTHIHYTLYSQCWYANCSQNGRLSKTKTLIYSTITMLTNLHV